MLQSSSILFGGRDPTIASDRHAKYLDRHRASVVDLVNSGSSGLAAAERQCTVMDGLLSALYLGAVARGIAPTTE